MSLDTRPRTPRPGRSRPAAPPLASGAVEPPASPGLPQLPGRRNPRWIALGVVALCLGALLSYVVYTRVASEATVVAVAETVYRGEVIEAGDLTTVRLQGGVLPDAVPAADRDRLIGRRAVFDLPAGSVVASGSVADTAVPAEGRSVVGLLLPAGNAPADLLLPGAPVRLVALPPSAATGAQERFVGTNYLARVVDQSPGADGVSTMLDVDVQAAQAPAIALLAAQQRVAVVRDAGR
ncbi:SAF domain-containing protein [uncultured Friedmanniella sp.]|uniref:SAF domain-containing protein n=1 Tax=uncultured Friedmanniella sp. TaxID=335381 RepID=UPI0035C95155